MNSLPAVIFDMDGVIFDTERAVISCWKTLSETCDLPDIENICIECIGTTSEMTRSIMLRHYGNDFPYDELSEQVSRIFEQRYSGRNLPVKNGAEHILSHLKAAGIKVALASSTRSDIVRRELTDTGLIGYFDEIVGGEMAARSKPAPDIFLMAAEKLAAGSSPDHFYVIEDSYNGIRAAHAAGMHPVMVPDILQPDEEIRSLAEIVLPDLYAAADWLLSGSAPGA